MWVCDPHLQVYSCALAPCLPSHSPLPCSIMTLKSQISSSDCWCSMALPVIWWPVRLYTKSTGIFISHLGMMSWAFNMQKTEIWIHITQWQQSLVKKNYLSPEAKCAANETLCSTLMILWSPGLRTVGTDTPTPKSTLQTPPSQSLSAILTQLLTQWLHHHVSGRWPSQSLPGTFSHTTSVETL